MFPLYGLPTSQSQFRLGKFLVGGWLVSVAFVILIITVSSKTNAYYDRANNEGGFGQERIRSCHMI